MEKEIKIRYNKEKQIWEVSCDGKKIAEGKDVCALCMKHRYCDYDEDRGCGVLS
jgi:hypothetical protein